MTYFPFQFAGVRSPVEIGGDARASRWPASEAPPQPREDSTLYVAVVHTPREVCFVTAAASDSALQERLATYVRQHAHLQLWPEEARRVEDLLAAGNAPAAIWLYFDSTGTRWDEERLRIEVIDPSTDRARRGP